MFCLDREARARIVSINTTEARFKVKLSKKKYRQVMKMVKHSRLCGWAIVAYISPIQGISRGCAALCS